MFGIFARSFFTATRHDAPRPTRAAAVETPVAAAPRAARPTRLRQLDSRIPFVGWLR